MIDRQTLPEVVGENARKLRLEAGATLEQVAAKARALGLKWSTARVVELERGKLAINVVVLLVLAQALGDVTGRRIALGDLVHTQSWIQLNNQLALAPAALEGALAGDAIDWTVSDVEGGLELVESVFEDVSTITHDPDRWPLGSTVGDVKAAHDLPIGLTETRVARQLGVTPRALNAHAFALWGTSLTQRRDEIAPAGSTAQARGHLTRELVEEIRRSLEGSRARGRDG